MTDDIVKRRVMLESGALRRNALSYLSARQRRKYEVAKELGLLDKLIRVGWAGLTTEETGRIGGHIARGNGKRH